MKKEAKNCYIVDSDPNLEYIEGNRDPLEHPDHIRNIARAMERHEFIPPLIVANYNEHKYIVDGQHRYEAAKLLWNKDKSYDLLITEYNSINPFLEAIKFNNSKLDWTLITYLKAFAINGNPNYQEFLNWINCRDWNRKNISYEVCLALLGVRNKEKLKNGIFQLGISFIDASKIYDTIKDTDVFSAIVTNGSSAKAFYKIFSSDRRSLLDLLQNYNPEEYEKPIANRIRDWEEYFGHFINQEYLY